MIKLRFDQKGDTIVEVMLAVAVLGAVIGGAYGIATRSLRSTLQTQERNTAIKIAEEQLEALRFHTANEGVFTDDCFEHTQGTPSSDACTRNIGVDYTVAITNLSVESYRVEVRWDRAGGGEEERVSLVYKAPSGS